jgi:NADPH:quinone reductase-like Zn-dependent oxidoreductase
VRAVRLNASGGPESLTLDEIEVPSVQDGDALVRVHAAAITRGELDWPADRIPAIPSYELSGVVADVGPTVDDISVGEAVFALTPFDRDGVAADYVALPADLLVAKPRTLDHVESAALPLPALSAWQGLFDHGHLREGQRVVVSGAAGGVGHIAVQLAGARGAEVLDREAAAREPVDLVFDTVGGDLLATSGALVRAGGRIVSVAEEGPPDLGATYFVVAPNRDQLVELARLADDGLLRPRIDSVFSLEDARTAFERSMARGKHGKVVLRVADTDT